MPVSSFFGGIQRFAGQAIKQGQRAYGQIDKATGGWLPGGAASPLSPIRQISKPYINKAASEAVGAGLNLLPDRVNLFARYITGVGNTGLQLDRSTLSDLRMATEQAPTAEIATPISVLPKNFLESLPPEATKNSTQFIEKIKAAGPGFPASGPVYPYYEGAPKSVTNTLGRFTADANREENTLRIRDKYDMVNVSEDPDLVSGKIQPQKAWNEIESIWNPAAMGRNSPRKQLLQPENEGYSPESVKRGLIVTGDSPTYSPATRFARAFMYALPVKPQPYDIDITIPYKGEIQ